MVSFLFSIGLATPAAAFCRLTTESPSASEGRQTACSEGGIILTWKQRCISYTLVPHDELLALGLNAVRDTIDASFATWTAVRCSKDMQPFVLGQTVELGACSHAEYNRFGPNANTIAFARDWESRGRDFVPEAYALTLVWHNPESGEILDADIQINLNRGPIVICGETCEQSDQVDLQNVLTHEAGHFLGLAHSEVGEAAMFGDAPKGQVSKRRLHPDDVRGICDTYQHLPTAECEVPDFAPRRGFSPTCVQPDDSGMCAASGAPGRGDASASMLAPYLCALALLLGRGRWRWRRT